MRNAQAANSRVGSLSMTANWLFSILNVAPYGAYAVSLDQTILFWNRSAERILGHTATDAIGRHCYLVLNNLAEGASTPICLDGCPSIEFAKAGRSAPVVQLWMLCASGQRKLLTVTPLVIPQTGTDQPVLLHLFHERNNAAQAGRIAGAVSDVLSEPRLPYGQNELSTDVLASPASLSVRETEMLRLLALGLSTQEIADDRCLSTYTVRNYVRSAREKLQARTKLDAVMTAQRLGLL